MAAEKLVGLPRPLAPWARELSIFPPRIAGILGRLVQRVASAIDSIDFRPRRGLGEPDGFDGLDRRGAYERLLTSEWLLAEDLPEEFDRRLLAGELSFLKLARVEPVASRLSVALVDTGPSQLGAPRIAQLAALIALARRAAGAQAEFSWGVVQRWDAALQPSLTHESVRGLLEARDFREVSSQHLDEWRIRLAKFTGLEETWFLGGERLKTVTAAPGVFHLQIEDVLEPGPRRVSIALHRASRTLVRLSLDLPEPADCVRLLRDPFAVEAPRARQDRRFLPESNLVFDAAGVRLFARSADGGVVLYPIPNPNAAMKPKRYPSPDGRRVAAVGFAQGLLDLVTLSEEGTSLHRLHCRGSSTRWDFEAVPWLPPLETVWTLRRCFWVSRSEMTPEGLAIPFPPGRLTVLETAKRALHSIDLQAVAVAPVRRRLVVIGRPPGNDRWLAWTLGPRPPDPLQLDGECRDALFGFGRGIAHPDFGFFAVLATDGKWFVHSARGRIALVPPSGFRVVGIGVNPTGDDPALIVLQDSRTVLLAGRRQFIPLARAPEDIEYVTVSSSTPLVAYSTVAGELFVLSLARRRILLRLTPEGTS